jgi:hypothetical protein
MALIGAFSQLFFWVWVSNPRIFRMSPNNCFRSAHGKNQMSRLPRKNEALGIGNNGFPFLLLFFGQESSAGSDRAALKTRRPMMRLAAFRIRIASLSRRFGMGEGTILSIREGGTAFFFLSCPPLPIASFFARQSTTCRHPHAIVACITPVLAKCILLSSCHLFAFLLPVVVCVCSSQRAR